MVVISLLQPWASLAVMGVKKIETRSWNTPFRGELYIHASLGKHYGKGFNKVSCRELCYQEPFKSYIDGGLAFDKLPFGKIIGRVNLLKTMQTEDIKDMGFIMLQKENIYITDHEEYFGDYSPGRFGWILTEAQQFDMPIPAKGKQGFWNYEPQTF